MRDLIGFVLSSATSPTEKFGELQVNFLRNQDSRKLKNGIGIGATVLVSPFQQSNQGLKNIQERIV